MNKFKKSFLYTIVNSTSVDSIFFFNKYTMRKKKNNSLCHSMFEYMYETIAKELEYSDLEDINDNELHEYVMNQVINRFIQNQYIIFDLFICKLSVYN